MNWVLAISYWIHLLATVVWLGGITLMLLVAWPALQQGSLASNQWFNIQRRFMPWANASLVILLVTGFLQMSLDSNYTGFLQVDSAWAWAILLKHIVFAVMVIITVYVQVVLYPAMTRLTLLEEKNPNSAADERDKLRQQEVRMLRLNVLCAAGVLLFTAIATAI
ncbi:MAG: CopD family protein [Candidatus Promineifilaceae bacterium]|nr:CopD family protein [Candidatus Promineifilaceae bacterium]